MAKVVVVGIPAVTERQLFLLCGKGQTGQHILMAELGEVLQQFSLVASAGRGSQHIADRKAGSPNVWLAVAAGHA